MDKATEKHFKSTLVKNLQFLCTGYVPFQSNIEIIGHIYMRVDNSKKYNYFLEEKIAKTDFNGTILSSQTFLAKPESSDPSISTLHPGFADEQITVIKTNNTTVPTDLGGQTTFTLQVPVPASMQVPVSAPAPSPEWMPTVKIQNVTSLAPGAQKKISILTPEINNQSTKSETSNTTLDETCNISQDQNNQINIPTENTSQSASDILKAISSIKKEPKDSRECQSPQNPVPPPVPIPPLPSTSQPQPKQKRKTSHAMRTELEPFVNKEAVSEKKKPRIIKSRPMRRKILVSDVDEGSQSSSGDFADVPVHFGELTSASATDEDEVFPVSILKNLSGFEEACNQSVAFLSQNQAMRTAFQDPKRRGTYNFYTEAEKQKAIDLAAQFGVTAICQRFGIPSSTLWTWKKIYQSSQNPESQNENMNELETTESKAGVKKGSLRKDLSEDDEGETTTPPVSASGRKQRITVKKEPYSP